MNKRAEWKKIQQIIEGDGSEIREQLVLAGLLLMLFEQFKTSVSGFVASFFATEWEFRNDNIVYKHSDELKKIIKEYGKGESGQHRNEEFRASLKWLQSLDAITEDELREVERLYLLRNDIGHEMLSIITDDKKRSITIEDITTTFAVYLKIVRWWIKNVEASTNPDVEEANYDDTAFESAESGATVFLKIIISKALLGVIAEDVQNPTLSD